MKKFEVGKKYEMHSICDCDCIWTYTVTARTAQTITITDGEKVKKCRISKIYSDEEGEAVLPLGNCSMCPVLRAKREVA